MATIFYTYVWGSRRAKGSRLTFSHKRDRTVAVQSTQEGDLVFGVVSRDSRDTSVRIPDDLKGRVVNAWQISHNMAQAADFGVEAMNPWDKREDGSYRWPYALQPIRVGSYVMRRSSGNFPDTANQPTRRKPLPLCRR